jgi:cytochrome c oxidase subunit 5a
VSGRYLLCNISMVGCGFSRENLHFPPLAVPLIIMRSQTLSNVLRAAARPSVVARSTSTNPILFRSASSHAQETFESFSERYVKFFQNAEDLFEVQRGLNNCFAHDLVPSTAVVEAAIRAARRVNDYATAVRVFEGVREKVESKSQYQAYVDELKPLREELGAILVFYHLPYCG